MSSAFTCASAIGNLLSICSGVNILICTWLKTLRSNTLATRPSAMCAAILGIPFP